MKDRNEKNISTSGQFGIFLGLTGGGVILGAIATVAIWMMMTGGALPGKAEDILVPKYYGVNMVMQAVSTFIMFFLPVYFFAVICYKNPNRYLGFNTRFSIRQVLYVIAILIITFPLAGALGELNKILPIPQNLALKFKAMEAAREAQEAALININSFNRYLISLFIIALLPAVFEEVFFRGGLQNLLVKWFKGPWVAIIATSIVFSLIHMSYYGFLVRFALGVILGLVYYYSKNIWLNILFHFLFNGLQVTVLYFVTITGVKGKKDIEANFPVWAGFLALALLLLLFYQFRKASADVKAKYPEPLPEESFDDWTHLPISGKEIN